MIRYPGSKDKIARQLIGRFPPDVAEPLFNKRLGEYREPFFGGGAVGLRFLRTLPRGIRVWLNDKDRALVCLWQSIRDQPKALSRLCLEYTPSVDDFYAFKEQDGDESLDPLTAGFRKLALHQISFSGNGVMAGGPIGGREQRSEFNVACRWNGARTSRKILAFSKLFAAFDTQITHGDFAPLIDDAPPEAFVYVDPPYYKAGPQLYKHAFDDDAHARLAASLAGCPARWVLSYDDHPRIRELYAWAQIESVEMTYTTAVSKGPRRKNSELVIKPLDAASEAA